MTRILSLHELPVGVGPSAVTIGKFDGVHRGHRELLRRLLELARDRGLASTVITFDRNPLALLAPQACPADLVSLDQKLELLGASGLDAVVVAEFTRDFAGLQPEEFAAQVLVAGLDASAVLVGPDFRFGARGAGDVDRLRELGATAAFDVVVMEEVGDSAGERVSSSAVRERLSAGDMQGAAELLGRPHRIRSTVVQGQRRGRALGYPTANLDPAIEGFVPADGVYAAWLLVDGQRYGAAVSIGNNPTFEGVPDKQVEVHAFDQSFDLYGKTVEVEFAEFIRGMQRFAGPEELAHQLRADDERIRALLNVQRP